MSRVDRRRKYDAFVAAPSSPAQIDAAVADLQASLTTPQRLVVLEKLQDLLQPGRRTAEVEDVVDSRVASLLVEAGATNILLLQLGHTVLHHDGGGDHGAAAAGLCRVLCLLAQYALDATHARLRGELCHPRSLGLMVGALRRGIDDASVLAVLHVLSARPDGAQALVRFQDLLSLIMQSLAQQGLAEPALLDGLGCLKNVTCYADDHRTQFLRSRTIRAHLCALVRRLRTDKARERVTAVLRNISLSHECRPLLMGDPDILRALVDLSGSSAAKPVLRNVLNMWISLTMDHDAGLVVILHADGVFLRRIQGWLADREDLVRRRAARLLRSLAHDRAAPLLAADATLMGLLSDRARCDACRAVRAEAAEAFARCAAAVRPDQPHHRAVLVALLHLARSPGGPVEAVARTLREQAAPLGNRAALAECPKLLETAAGIAVARDSSVRSREDICVALLDLSYENANLQRMIHPDVLDSLVQNARVDETRSQHLDIDAIGKASIETLLRIATCPMNRAKMVNHHSLLETMIRYAASSSDTETKGRIKAVIVTLVGEL